MADARDWAICFLARRFLRISIRRTVLAFCTAMLGGCDLDPLAVLHDWFWRCQFSVKAACAALSILGPLADCRFRARLWHRIFTWANFALVKLTALLATVVGFDGDNPVTRLSAIRAALIRARIPL